jgi:hypothetical protein
MHSRRVLAARNPGFGSLVGELEWRWMSTGGFLSQPDLKEPTRLANKKSERSPGQTPRFDFLLSRQLFYAR